ncbi:efflux RND transporter permease subunit [Microcystis aeruginosa CS-338/01]|uniref:efflux RND transporter permease subunit n=1 Tax=Microcystis aeruginosa TaxID=1126 RepID=UPI00232D84F3|nr:efflux RND transporter permease subunit [Microcystis aeruginosa]MDB9509356.1 efflux RND transporter permease subunit [Microcystis aeruginosa CS-338/01]
MKESWRERLNISRIAINAPRLTIAFWLAVAMAGILAFSSLKYALFPDISFPVVIINAQADLATAITTEQQLTKPLENPLFSLPGRRDISSTTSAGQSVISIFFKIGTNLDKATAAVKQAISQVPLPSQATTEVIPVDLNESATVTYALVSEQKTLEELSQIAQDNLIPPLKALPGTAKVNLLGQGTVREDNPYKGLTRPLPTLVRFNGQEAIAVQVIKKGAANSLDLAAQAEKLVKDIAQKLPDVKIILAETQAEYIRAALQGTIDDLLLAVLLSVLVILIFLGSFAATIISALVIPLSLLGTFIIMAIYGFNLETLTLLALALVIGIVVDDAIVDVENISRLIDAGETPKNAALKGTREIGLAVTASTLTIVAVFIPVAFMGGAVGQFFQPFGLTVSAAVIFSLLIARTLSPVLAVYWLKPQSQAKMTKQKRPIENAYRRLLNWSLRHRLLVIAIALITFLAGIALIPFISRGFIPRLDRGEFNLVYTSPLPKITQISPPFGLAQLALSQAEGGKNKPTAKSSSDSFAWISQLASSPESFLLRRTIRDGSKLEAPILQDGEVESTFLIAGLRGEPNRGKIHVTLKGDRKSHTSAVQQRIRQILPPIRGVNVSIEDIPFVQTEAEKPIQIAIKSDNLQLLRDSAEKLRVEAAKIAGLKDISLSSRLNERGDFLAIERLNGQQAIFLSANLSPDLGLEDAAIKIEAIPLPEGITLQRWGTSSQSSDVLGSFGRTLILATILMLGVLWLLFRRLLETIVIALCLPLAIVGAMLGLLVTGSEFSMISLIGFIFLLGLLDKNAVLLLDYTNQLRQQGWSREEAVLETGMIRLRPILMTTCSTILGMIPIALGLGTGAELRQPMAMVIVGGLVTSSLLSLIVVPVLYLSLEDVWNQIKAWKK